MVAWRGWCISALVLGVVGLGGCASSGDKYQASRYSQKHDSAPSLAPSVDHVQDAVPMPEIRTAAGNKSPYVVLGKKYRVLESEIGYKKRGVASWYGSKFHGHATSNGEIYDMYAMTAAHKTLPIPSYVQVKNLANGKTVIVRVNDRGPFHGNRIIDLTYAAAKKLDYLGQGTAQVEVTAIDPVAWQKQNAARLAAAEARRPAQASAVNAQTTSARVASLPANTYLQVGAFSNQQAAEHLRDQLIQWLEHPVRVSPPGAATSLYRVRVGPVADTGQVSKIRSLLARNRLAAPHLVYE
ncbi:septal ring lytic transglycosylase RlpA family protein [Halioxenophilus aromaticivorans]|uniref:Endolytic peptidoglycan transglycosylase RlpA n=1 Tax=Halioxenophilus aromaticivorans TaxID=1306992 RepID=A0AAV3U0V0_9ALTE